MADIRLLYFYPLGHRDQIWIPKISFYNTETRENSVHDEKCFGTIERRARPVSGDKRDLHNSHIFKGNENPITFSRYE